MKKLLTLVLIVLSLCACNESTEVLKDDNLNLLPKVTSTVVFDNPAVIDKIKKRNSGRLAWTADYSNAELVTFEGTTIKGVVTPIDGSKTLFNYVSSNNEVYQEQFVHEVISENGVTTSNFYDVDGNLLFYLTVEGDDIRIYKGKSESAERFFRESGWLSTSAECVGNVLDQMTDGSIIGSASALGCMAWGVGCAVAVGVSCGIMGFALM